MRTALTFALAVAVLSTGAACGRPAHRNARDLVPANAVAMLALDWQQVRTDPALRPFATLPASASALRQAGVPVDAADWLVGFTILDSSGSIDGLIVSSPAIVEQFVAAAPAHHWSQRPGGAKMYVHPSGLMAVTAFESVAVGPAATAEAVAEVLSGTRPSFVARGELESVRDLVEGVEPIHAAAVWPLEARDASRALSAGSAALLRLGGLGALGDLVERLGIGRAIAMSCASQAGAGRCRLAGVMDEESTASIVSGGLTALKGLASLLPQPPPQARGAAAVSAADLTVERRGSTVIVGVPVR